MNSTTLKSVLKLDLWMCTVTFQRATVYHYVPIQNKICRLHVLLNCMYADAFVFIQGKT